MARHKTDVVLYMSSALPHTQKKTECREEVNDVGSSYEKSTL